SASNASDSRAIETLYGLHAGLAVFERRPEDIRAVAFESGQREPIAALLHWATARGVPIQEVSARELSNRVDSNQHEGLVLDVRARSWLSPKELATWLVAERGVAVALDRVRNPQNIGAILRSAAFFGVGAALLGAPAPHPGLAPFALRVAEGAAEHLVFSRTTDLADTLGRLRSGGVYVIGADTHSPESSDALLTGPGTPGATVLVLGNEREGLSPRIRAQCDALFGIVGSGTVESLNVAVAAGVIFSDLRRARATRRSSARPEAR
ncbi:MAG TPA: RNA methyltransferase, partial [Polyangiaceae bacterium]|nr:RNA methyltransferase [Polyangiaceae bacterium]